MATPSPVDRLLEESERLRNEMLKTAGQLKKFSDDLLAEVRALRAAAGFPIDRGGGGGGGDDAREPGGA